MHTIAKLALPASAVLALAACASPGQIESAKAVQPSGTGFTQYLAKDYSDYTRFEADEMYDWPDADYFAEKTLAAAEGRQVAPANPDEWDIERADWRAELKQARGELVDAYQDGFREDMPEVAASAQANYDCWVEQAEEGWQYDHIAKCREGFMAAMMKRDQPAQMVESAPPVLVFFDWDVAALPSEANRMLDAVASVARDNPQMEFDIVGHADTSGTANYNVGLSRERAQNVADGLAARGISASRMDVSWQGESDPRVPTGDGVREPQNRRVVIEAGGPTQPPMASLGSGGMTGSTGDTGTEDVRPGDTIGTGTTNQAM